MIHSIRVLRGKIEAEITTLEHSLGRGDAQDYAHYKMVTGQIVGLRTCLTLCDDIEGEDGNERHYSGEGHSESL